MHTTCNLACSIKPRDWAPWPYDGGIHINLKPTHAVVDHRCDYRHIERLCCHCRPRNDVVIELFATSGLSACLIPGLATGVRRPGPSIRILLGFLCSLVVCLM